MVLDHFLIHFIHHHKCPFHILKSDIKESILLSVNNKQDNIHNMLVFLSYYLMILIIILILIVRFLFVN